MPVKICVSCAEVYWYLSDFTDSSAEEVSRGIGLAVSTVRTHLRTLEKDEVIVGRHRPKIYRLKHNPSAQCNVRLKELEPYARQIKRPGAGITFWQIDASSSLSACFAAGSQLNHLTEFPGFSYRSSLFSYRSSLLSDMPENMDTYLFNSREVAQEVAWVLRGEWDGVNAVAWNLSDVDGIALSTAASLENAEYCRENAVCLLGMELEGSPVFEQALAGKSYVLSESLLEVFEVFMRNLGENS